MGNRERLENNVAAGKYKESRITDEISPRV